MLPVAIADTALTVPVSVDRLYKQCEFVAVKYKSAPTQTPASKNNFFSTIAPRFIFYNYYKLSVLNREDALPWFSVSDCFLTVSQILSLIF